MASVGNLVINWLGNSSHAVKHANMVQSSIGSVIKFASGAAAALGVAWGAGQIVSTGISEALGLETAHTQFEVLLGDGDQAKAMMATLRDFAAETPFQFGEISDSTKLLLNAGVAADDMVDSLRMIGDLAAAGGKPLNEVAYVFGQVRTAGRLMGQDLNQLLNANIPAISALAAEFGVAETEVRDLVSTGAVTFDRLESAMKRLTGEGGQLNGMTQKLSQTTAGLWSTLQDNVTATLAEFGTAFIEAADVKGWLAYASDVIGQIPEYVNAAKPIVQQFFDTAIALGSFWLDHTIGVFSTIGDVASLVFEAMGFSGSMTFSDLIEYGVGFLAGLEYIYQNVDKVQELAWANAKLYAVSWISDLSHIIYVNIPELLNWFGENWASVLNTVFDLGTTIFINLGENIRDVFSEVYNYITSGFTDEIDWSIIEKDLTKGYVNSIREIPELTAREMSAVEKELQANADKLGGDFGVGLTAHIQTKLQEYVPALAPPETTDETPETAPDLNQKIDETPETAPDLNQKIDDFANRRPAEKPAASAAETADSGSRGALSAISGTEAIAAVFKFQRDQEQRQREQDAKARDDRSYELQLRQLDEQKRLGDLLERSESAVLEAV